MRMQLSWYLTYTNSHYLTDVASLVGFEQPEYNVNEDDGFVEICAAIMEPSNVLLLPDSYLANFSLSLVNGAALGKVIDILSHPLTFHSQYTPSCVFLLFS